jgi:Meckel syndrome type 1 protein
MDPEEAANKSTEGMLSNPNAKEFGDAGTSETAKATPKATPKAAPKAAPKPVAKSESKPAAKAAPVDVTKLSVAERRKLSRENPSVSGPTDTRSVSQRLRSAFGMKSGGATKMASGGMTSSASKRADGIAVKGKTRGKMC